MKIMNEYGDFLQHVHISDENLQRPGLINSIDEHKIFINSLKKNKYNKYLSIEMIRDKTSSIVEGIRFVKNNYIKN